MQKYIIFHEVSNLLQKMRHAQELKPLTLKNLTLNHLNIDFYIFFIYPAIKQINITFPPDI